nr:hypothetical protein [Anaeromicropila populeti]
MGTNYNLPKSEDARVPQCPPDKEKAITNALKHFKMIQLNKKLLQGEMKWIQIKI